MEAERIPSRCEVNQRTGRTPVNSHRAISAFASTRIPLKGPLADVPALLIWAILALLGCGIELGGSLQPTRVVVVFAFLLTLSNGPRVRSAALPTKSFLVVAAVWLTWGTTSLLWTPDFAAGLHEIVGIALGALTVVTLVNLSTATTSALKAIRLGWVSAFTLTLPFSLWELAFDQHLPHSYGQLTSGGSNPMSIRYAASTFGNQNTYIAFVTLAFPFLLWSIAISHRPLRRLLHVCLALVAAALVVVDSSRLGAVALAVQLCAWMCFTWISNKRANRSHVFVMAAVFSAIILLAWHASPYTQLRFSLALGGHDQSIAVRLALLKDGLQMIAESGGMGIGAGGFASLIASGRDAYNTSSGSILVVNPHNLWIEVFSQYGVVVGALFLGWVLLLFAVAVVRLMRAQGASWRQASVCVVVLLVGLPMNSMLNSAYLTFTILWCGLGSIVVMTSIRRGRMDPSVRRVGEA